jgi:hypothetical protein
LLWLAILGHQIPQVADFGLAYAVNAAEALLQPVGVPGQDGVFGDLAALTLTVQ